LDAKSASTSTIEAAEELVTKLGLKELLDLPAIALSNGQTRRARIIRALLAHPHVLLLDEPLSKSPLLPLYTILMHI
jgi:ABC-type molybdenum transport system ATPase subunit/photorepair protein PhrA